MGLRRLDGLVGIVIATRHHDSPSMVIPEGDPVFDRLHWDELEHFFAAAMARDSAIVDLRRRAHLAKARTRALRR